MPWSSELPTGNFSPTNLTPSSTSSSWLPIHPDYQQINVEKRSEWLKIFGELINFRLDFLYNDYYDTACGLSPNLPSRKSSRKSPQNQLNYLFHYIDHTIIVLEQYFDRQINTKLSSKDRIRYRYVLFANLGNQTVIKDFSDKFRFSRTQLATNINRTQEFLIMNALRLDPGEALIVTVE
ncbi:hypothetical protein DERP_003638 [Dermatophagoides pteronyssinus]|uniref:Uncharacterized protein n=2 Tax=Dermatophagoides pteronyssinus TaxID=6956 RepID=A0ABQ8JLB0_DERPT|nr:hypothetical protein DERP_003638 [Dermatophagoides pteronyssinus]